MPVDLLLCEGKANSPDIRVLTKLLAGHCGVIPSGGKYGMGERIIARRDAIGRHTVYGILDGDFVADFRIPTDRPSRWTGSDNTHFGWRWERKEIENYLLDPVIVQRTLGAVAPPPADYSRALEAARDTITIYQAARIALSIHRPRFSPLSNCFGPKRGRLQHPFPDVLDQSSCLQGIQQTICMYQGNIQVSETSVEVEFHNRVPECQPGGNRFRAFLHAFSGKDLLFAMSPTLVDFGFASPAVFVEKVLVGIDQTTEDLADWLAEWRALRLLVSNP